MTYKCLADCTEDLEKHHQLLRISQEVDPYLELAEIHRQVFSQGGPALLFEKVRGTPFPVLSNLFGNEERCRLIFRKTWDKVSPYC